MRLGTSHLTYCTNVHPGETWPEVREIVERHLPAVKQRLAPALDFGVGLRLSAAAAGALQADDAREVLLDRLKGHGLYVFTLNGFPYGAFHGTRVKQAVYLPDWRSGERLTYTRQLARVLAHLLPPDVSGSISTVPVGFKPAMDPEAERRAVRNLLAIVADLYALWRQSGRRIRLALEPEPGCRLETVDETVMFFQDTLRHPEALTELSGLLGESRARAEEALQEHLGVCLDTCHAAVEFEDPRACVAKLSAAEIRIAKLQLSSGLHIERVDAESVAALQPYCEDVYLHQVVERRGQALVRYLDLPEAIAAFEDDMQDTERAWRVHFHVPIFQDPLRTFGSTQGFLREILALHRQRPLSEHLEVETYTWNVLPPHLRGADVIEDIARELQWARAALAPASTP